MLLGWRNIIRLTVIASAAGVIAYLVWWAMPPATVTIEAGPVGGSYYSIAEKYREALRDKGINLVIKSNPDSLQIVDNVERLGSGIDIGFTAQALDHKKFLRTRTVGTIQLQPLFLFVQNRFGPVSSPTEIRGLRVVMPPERSATSQAALAVLHLSGVSRTNTSIEFRPLADAVSALRKGDADAGLFMLDPSNAFIDEMLTDANLHLVSFAEGSAMSRRLPFLQMVILPRGSLAVDTHIPSHDAALLAASVNIVVRSDLHPAILYMLFEIMKEVHHGATLVSDIGAFPSLKGSELLPHPLAVEFFRSGMPWIYRNLPLSVASLVDEYLVIGIAFLLVAEVYKNFKYLRELANGMMEYCCLYILKIIEQATACGQDLGRIRLFVVCLAEQALARTNKRQRSQQLIGQIRQRNRG